MSSTEHRIDRQCLEQFVQAIWRHAGSTEQEAARVADHLVQANLAGHDSHGVGMIPSYMSSLAQGHLQLNVHAKVVRDAGAVLTVDGGQGFGQVVACEAMEKGIERARQLGLAAVALHNSHHIGRIGHWAEQCARAGFISIHFVNVVGDPMVHRSAAVTVVSAPTPSALFFPVKIKNRYCWILPPAASRLVKPAWPTTKV